MLGHYLQTVIRQLWKRKLYSFINLISLARTLHFLRDRSVMAGSGFIALERGQAEFVFGSAEAALDERITVEGQRIFSTNPGFVSAQPAEFQVAAVYELPEPISNSMRFMAIAPDNGYSDRLLPRMNGNRIENRNVWVKLAEGVNAEQVNEQPVIRRLSPCAMNEI